MLWDHGGFPRVTGHRGAKQLEPENTMRSFRLAEALGADEVELDVHLAGSGELVVIHDETFDRTTNGVGAVADADFATLRTLDAGLGEVLPTLDEVIDGVSIAVQVEVKAVAAATAISALAQTRPDWQDRVFLTSFHTEVLQEFRAKVPHFRRGLIAEGWSPEVLAAAIEVEASVIYVSWPGLDVDAVEKTKAAGIAVVVWLVNDEESWRRARELGVDGISTDAPGVIADLREQDRAASGSVAR